MSKPDETSSAAVTVRRVVFRLLLPAITAAALLYYSPREQRPMLSDSAGVDIVARVWLAGIWTFQFMILSDSVWARKWLLVPADHEASSDLAAVIWDAIRIALSFFLPAMLAYFPIGAFLPSLGKFALPIAAVYGALSAIPVWLVLRPSAVARN